MKQGFKQPGTVGQLAIRLAGLTVILVACLISFGASAQARVVDDDVDWTAADTVECDTFSVDTTLYHGTGALIRNLFAAMPDSLAPLLSRSNRLDMIDFIDAGMKAEVTNNLGGHSEMKALSADSLEIQLSSVSWLDMMLKPSSDKSGDSFLISLTYTYRTNDDVKESVVRHFTEGWRQIDLKE